MNKYNDLNSFDNLTFEEKVKFINAAMGSAKTIVAVAIQQVKTGLVDDEIALGWHLINMLVREREEMLSTLDLDDGKN